MFNLDMFSKKNKNPLKPKHSRNFNDNHADGDDGIGKKVKSLWTIAVGKPKSERFSQLSFEGFGFSHGKSKLLKYTKPFHEFLIFIKKYLTRKTKYIARTINVSLVSSVNYLKFLKNYLVRKLIWSQGKLGRPIATVAVVIVAFLVFMFGEVFNSSRFVNSQEINPDYLQNVTDIIPQKNIALTTIPESRKQAEPFNYTVESGDTLSTIGSNFRISTDAIKYVNGLSDNSIINVGQVLVIPPVTGLIHEVESGDTLDSIAETYDVAPQAIADFNYILDTSQLAVGTELVIPDAKVPQPVIVPSTPASINIPTAPAVDTSASQGWCMWPTSARIITQYFAWYHNGLDIASPGFSYPPLFACAGGTVTRAGWDPWGLGLHVIINHGNGYETVYGHMNRIDVGYGESVGKGQVIGQLGNTGRSTGPHVHFIIKYNGVPQNPLNYIQ